MTAPDLGTDLRVVLGPPGMQAHDTSPLDLRTAARLSPSGDAVSDLAAVAQRHNLGQALTLRLLTPLGALADLGHATYGSRLGELVGRRKDDTARALCKAFVLEAVAQESRVDPAAVEFAFEPDGEGPSELRFRVAVRPVTGGDPVTLDLGIGL